MVHRIFPLENINHKHAFSSYINHCLPVFCQIADNIFSACRKSYSKYLLFKKNQNNTWIYITKYILLLFYCNAFFNFFFFLCIQFISIFYPVWILLFFTRSETHKFTFDFGVCCKTKLIFYGQAHLAERGKGGKMAWSIRFSKFMARVSVRYVPLYFCCVIYMYSLCGDLLVFCMVIYAWGIV